MKFGFNTSSEVMQQLLKYADFDEELLKEAMHSAHTETESGEPVSIESIIGHIDLLLEAKYPKLRASGA